MARKKKGMKVGQTKIVMRKINGKRRKCRVKKLGKGKYRVRVVSKKKRKSRRRRR